MKCQDFSLLAEPKRICMLVYFLCTYLETILMIIKTQYLVYINIMKLTYFPSNHIIYMLLSM